MRLESANKNEGVVSSFGHKVVVDYREIHNTEHILETEYRSGFETSCLLQHSYNPSLIFLSLEILLTA